MNTLTLLSDAKYFDEGNSKFAELRTLLDSKHTKEKLEAMKRLMAMITIGRDVSSFFPDVVKNIVVESQEVKKLVYMYLIHYAEQNQELALLSINSFQKDLASHSQRVRANAMKAMSSIRIPVAIPLVMLALKTAVKDQSSYVRRAAAAAIPKVWSVDTEQHELLIELIQELLTNNEPLVLGSAIFAFNAVCPERYDLLHPHFRKICHLLADFDEWGQIITLDLLLRYGRTQFLDPITASSSKGKNEDDEDGRPIDRSDALSPNPATLADVAAELSIFNTPATTSDKDKKKAKKAAAAAKSKSGKKKSESFYSDEEDESSSSSSDSASSSDSSNSGSDSDSDGSRKKKKKSSKDSKKKNPNPLALPATTSLMPTSSTDPFSANNSFVLSTNPTASADDADLDEDHKLLLKQAGQLLQSSNTGVIVGVCSLMWSLAPKAELTKIVKPLVRLSRNKRNIQYIVLMNIATMAASLPLLFRPYLKDFFIYQHEPRYIKDLKLDILTCITSEASIGVVLKEFTIYTQDPDKLFVIKCIQAIGRCAASMPSIAERCIRGLMGLVQKNGNDGVVAQSIVVIRQLLQANVETIKPSLLLALSKLLDGPQAITIPQARTAIIWMVGEYREKIPKQTPDILRKLVKTFTTEHEEVKVQILNLSLKLFLAQPKQTSLLFKYVMDLCKYDLNIDLRDRARMMRALFFKKKATADAPVKDHGTEVKDHFKSILLTEKPAPKLTLPFQGRDKWILGTLSHTLNQAVQGYKELPDFPQVQPDPTVRKPKVIPTPEQESKLKTMKADRKANKKHRRRRGSRSGSDSGSESGSGSDSDRSGSSRSSRSSRGSRSGSDSDRSRSSSGSSRSSRSEDREFSAFGSESDRASDSDGSSPRRRARSDSSSGSGSDSDASRKRRSKKKASSRRSRSRSRSRSTSPSEAVSPTSAAVASKAGAVSSWSLDFLDLKGLDLSSGALADPNLSSGGFGALGDSHVKFTHPGTGPNEDLLSPFSGLPSASPTTASPASIPVTTAAKAAAAENAILERAFGGKK